MSESSSAGPCPLCGLPNDFDHHVFCGALDSWEEEAKERKPKDEEISTAGSQEEQNQPN